MGDTFNEISHEESDVGDRIGFINPTELEVAYGDSHIIEPMTDEDIDEFRDRCLNDE